MDIQVTFSSLFSSLHDALKYLDKTLESDGQVTIDLRGTNMEFVKSADCVHCGRSIPIYQPISRYSPAPLRCERCEEICQHSWEADESFINTITKYSLSSPAELLLRTLIDLGFESGQDFSVVDHKGNVHKATILAP